MSKAIKDIDEWIERLSDTKDLLDSMMMELRFRGCEDNHKLIKKAQEYSQWFELQKSELSTAAATEEIVKHVFLNHWPDNDELVEYAIARHGFCGNDGYYGVTYSSDLDEYDRDVDGRHIPDGYVEVNFWVGEDKVVHITESKYLKILKQHLLNSDKASLVCELEASQTYQLLFCP